MQLILNRAQVNAKGQWRPVSQSQVYLSQYQAGCIVYLRAAIAIRQHSSRAVVAGSNRWTTSCVTTSLPNLTTRVAELAQEALAEKFGLGQIFEALLYTISDRKNDAFILS